METKDFFELTLSDGRTVRIPVVEFEVIEVTEGADGLFRDKAGTVVSLD